MLRVSQLLNNEEIFCAKTFLTSIIYNYIEEELPINIIETILMEVMSPEDVYLEFYAVEEVV